MSMRRRLVAMMLLSLVLVWGVMLALSRYEARQEVAELADTRLEEAAGMLLRVDLKTLQALAVKTQQGAGTDSEHDYHTSFQVWTNEGRLQLSSAGAPVAQFDPNHGFATVSIQGSNWRTYALDDVVHGYHVRVFEPEIAREDLANKIAMRMAQLLLVMLPVLALLLWLSVGRSLAPLTTTSREIASRGVDRLDPIELERVPFEVKTLTEALNRLLERLSISIDRERSFTADAAHELRTPLAAIKVQAEVALAAREDAEQHHAIRQVIAGVENATHLVRQLLLLARIEHSDSATIQAVDLGEIAMESARHHADDIVKNGIDIEVATQPECKMSGNQATLRVIVDNLIDNAIKYGGRDGRILLSVTKEGSALVLSVKDAGKGVPPETRARIMDRFYRGGGNEAPGSGLGLSIVDKIARVHRGELTLGEGLEGRGLSATVRFRSPF
jgi:two-component system sensor histidine kinase QseC